MDNEIKNRIPIDVDLAPNRDKLYSGIGLKSNGEVFILLCFNEKTKEYDGYAIIRDYEIEQYREWDDEEIAEIKNENSIDFIHKLPLDSMNNMFECLSELKDKKLIALYTESDENSYYVGQVQNLNEKQVEIKLISEDAEWLENKLIQIKEITYIGFDTSYEKELIKTLYNNI